MSDAELSRELALALGYYPESVRVAKWPNEIVCRVFRSWRGYEHWVMFDYRSPDVVLPLIEWLMREHDCTITYGTHTNDFAVLRPGSDGVEQIDEWHSTLAAAVAKACIAVKGQA